MTTHEQITSIIEDAPTAPYRATRKILQLLETHDTESHHVLITLTTLLNLIPGLQLVSEGSDDWIFQYFQHGTVKTLRIGNNIAELLLKFQVFVPSVGGIVMGTSDQQSIYHPNPDLS